MFKERESCDSEQTCFTREVFVNFFVLPFFFFFLFLTKGPTTGNGEIDAVRCSMVRRIPEPKNRLERICMSVHANSGTSPALQLLWPDPETDKALDGRS